MAAALIIVISVPLASTKAELFDKESSSGNVVGVALSYEEELPLAPLRVEGNLEEGNPEIETLEGPLGGEGENLPEGNPDSVTPEPTPTVEISPTPTEAVTPTPTEELTSTPTEELTPTPTEEVTPTPILEI